MKKFLLLPLFSLILFSMVHGQQKQPLTYYLPDISYEKDIPTPEEFLGFQIGEWHVSHDQQLAYMRKLAETSPRVTFQQIGNSYEGRPTINLIITSEKNHEKLDEIKADHVLLSDPTQSAEVDIKNLPTVLYQAYNIHGNEPSAGNSAILVAYYLAAGKGRDVERILDNVVTIIDPCLNPDGFNRFASWVNSHQNKNQTALGVDREYNEAWPGARTNHYWFDLNRDYMPVQHPESQGRINVFHDWKPNVYTDHHEMGTNSTFFFMPGEPSRVFPITPKKNQDLTEAIAQYHAATLDEIQSLYYAKEGFDDFYIGKGSTYPDVNGCIGILFEQASSRGHVQESANGLLTFPFTIRNQVRTSLSTQLACYELKDELNEFQREFYTTALEDARADKRKAFVFGDAFDKNKVGHFIEILRRHKIDVYKLGQQLEAGGKSFSPNHAYIIPTEQTQYRFIRSIFETQTTFEDSLFYDISTWTLPLAFNLPYSAVERNYSETLLGEKLEGLRPVVAFQEPDYSAYAYAFEWDDYYAPRAANYLMSQGLRLNVVNTPFVANGKNFNRGTVLVPLQNQPMSKDELFKVVLKASQDNKISIYDLDTGWTPEGPDLGSRGISLLRKPEVLLVVGEGTSPYDAGEVWHLLDQRYDIVTTKVEARDLDRIDPNRFNTIVMVDGSYSPVSQRAISGLQGWVAQGGTLIAYKRAISWCLRNGLGSATIKRPSDNRENQYLSSSGYASALQNNKEEEVDPRRPYAAASRDNGGKVIGGAIFNTTADLTHPLLYGYRVADLPIFRRGTLFLEPAKNPYATPVIYKNDPLLSGYINQENLGTIANTASIIVSGRGAGRILFMADNTNFRAFWFGTNKVLANAIFFGHTISSATIER
ncbi:MAG: M14 family zinc carboxypeptidase [Bacteroidota bacterium]